MPGIIPLLAALLLGVAALSFGRARRTADLAAGRTANIIGAVALMAAGSLFAATLLNALTRG